MKRTTHANKRIQQRAIPNFMLEIIQLYGDATYQKGGSEVIGLSKSMVEQLRKDVRRVDRQFDHLMDTYMVIQDEVIITAGHRR
jgi:hypothetical protein